MTHADIDIRYLNPEIEKLTYVAGKLDRFTCSERGIIEER